MMYTMNRNRGKQHDIMSRQRIIEMTKMMINDK